ncbi:tail lysozyme [Pseudanabaena phage Pam5]|nr:tail lysozyme [Pseudanabaena phage Pam5]
MAAFTDYKPLDFSGLDKSINSIAQKRTLSSLGQGLDGTPEGYAKAGQSLLALGDVQGAQNFFALGEKARERMATEGAIKSSPFNTGNFGTPRAPVAPALQGLGMPRPGEGGFKPVATVANSEAEVQALEGSTGTPGQKVAARLINNGLTPTAAAGLASNINAESRFRTDARAAGDGRDGSDSIGMGQWNGPRAIALQQFAASQGKDWRDPNVQADFVAYELRTTESRTGSVLNNATTPEQAGAASIGYFRPQGYTAANPMGALSAGSRVGNASQFVLGGEVAPPSDRFAPQPAQVAQAPQNAPAPGADGLYTNTPTPALQAFINNPRVPENLRTIMQQELARREGGQQPVQVAQAPAQPGQPVADIPAQGSAPVQAQFAIPGPNQLPPNDPRPDISTPQLLEVLANPRLASQHALAKAILDGRQKYSDENAPEKREQTRLATEKARLDVEKAKREADQSVTPETAREFVWARQNGLTTAKNPREYAREGTSSAGSQVEERKAAARAAGLSETDPRYQTFILTGKTPREDAQPLTATDKKAILEADEGVLAGETAIRALQEAKSLSKQSMSGPTAGARAAVGNNLPDWLVPDFIASPGAAEATTNLENTVTAQALAQMKSIFGAAPTEGERKILLDIQGSINQPDNVRQKIYDRAIIAAQARLKFNRQRADELRNNSYYKAPSAQAPAGQPAPAAQSQAAPQQQAAPAMQGARVAPDGNTYVPDPNRPGKYLMVQP